jgi:PAS domain S-box-containing protein
MRDLTEARRVQRALADSEERFASFMRHLPGFAFVKDHLRQVLYVNEQFETTFGIPLADWLNRPTEEVWPGEVGERIRRDDEAVMAAGRSRAVVEEIPTGGELRTYRTIKFPIPRPAGHAWLGGIAVDITELKRTEEALRSSIEEKESLLKEVHHRVKNTLQVISSLLNLQARRVTNLEVRAFLRDTQNRVGSMAMLHEILYHSGNLARISFPHYVKSLCSLLGRSYGSDARHIRLKPEVADVSLSMDEAVPMGLIINELVSNAFKHAFPGRDDGEVLIQVRPEGDHRLRLRVADDGAGIPAGRELQSEETLGLRLVHNLVRQLDGRMTISSDPGAVFQIVVPLRPVEGGSA